VTRGELGRRAELAVADMVFALGFDIIDRNVRLGPLEIDIVARKGALVIAVEVRTRGTGSLVGAFESVTRRKRRRLIRATRRLWNERLATEDTVERMRIDVAAVQFIRRETVVDYAEGAIGG